MGFRYVCVAVQGKPLDAVLADLGLEATGTQVRFGDAHLIATRCDAWSVVVAMFDRRGRYLAKPLLARLSAGTSVVVTSVDETSMQSYAAGWTDGRETWAVFYDGKVRPRGDPPAALADIEARLATEQTLELGDVDHLFDVPRALATAVTGFDPQVDDRGAVDALRLLPGVDPGFAGVGLEVEDRPAVWEPSLEQVHAEIDALTPKGGPGFLILNEGDRDYMQAAGGDGAYVAEWREVAPPKSLRAWFGAKFRHYAAGRRGIDADGGKVQVRTNAFDMTVRPNESLDATEVKEIAEAFLQRTGRPKRFTWRDMSADFS